MFFINIFYNNVAFYLKSGVITACGNTIPSYSAGGGSPNTSYVLNNSTFETIWATYGSIAVVSFCFQMATTVDENSDKAIITGLPPAKDYMQTCLTCYNDSSQNVCVRVRNDGCLYTSWLGSLKNNYIYKGEIVYTTS